MRKESLRRILESSVAGRLTDDQKREILGHLEDSVDAKLKSGMAEIEAVSRAFEEMGDLNKVAADFPAPTPVAVTPEGVLVGHMPAIGAYFLLLIFIGVVTVLSARLSAMFGSLNVEMPAAAMAFFNLGWGITTYWPLTVVLLVLLALAIARFGHRPGIRRVMPAVSLGIVVLFLAGIFCLVLPLVSLMQVMGPAR